MTTEIRRVFKGIPTGTRALRNQAVIAEGVTSQDGEKKTGVCGKTKEECMESAPNKKKAFKCMDGECPFE